MEQHGGEPALPSASPGSPAHDGLPALPLLAGNVLPAAKQLYQRQLRSPQLLLPLPPWAAPLHRSEVASLGSQKTTGYNQPR